MPVIVLLLSFAKAMHFLRNLYHQFIRLLYIISQVDSNCHDLLGRYVFQPYTNISNYDLLAWNPLVQSSEMFLMVQEFLYLLFHFDPSPHVVINLGDTGFLIKAASDGWWYLRPLTLISSMSRTSWCQDVVIRQSSTASCCSSLLIVWDVYAVSFDCSVYKSMYIVI